MLFSCDFLEPFFRVCDRPYSEARYYGTLIGFHLFISSWITVTFPFTYYVVRKCVASNECRCVFITYCACHFNVSTWLFPLALAWSLFGQSSLSKLPFLVGTGIHFNLPFLLLSECLDITPNPSNPWIRFLNSLDGSSFWKASDHVVPVRRPYISSCVLLLL